MNNMKLLTVMVIGFTVCCQIVYGYGYSRSSLYSAVKSLCCGKYGKRVIEPTTDKEVASAFLNTKLLRSSRGFLGGSLGYPCCVAHSCTVSDVAGTSLGEECINEGCTNEEIIETC